MSKYKCSELERQINQVLLHQSRELEGIKRLDSVALESRISESKSLLKSLGYELPEQPLVNKTKRKQVMVVPTWHSL